MIEFAKTKIYYLTRSFYPYQKGGGPLMRMGAVRYLKELGWDIIVITPNYFSKEIIKENRIIQIPFKGKFIQKSASFFERAGIYEDYLDKWVENSFEYLKNKIKKNDIIFATSGGELGTIKLGSFLEKKIGCKFVINFRDPLDYSLVNGLKLDSKFHVSRENQEKKYLSNSDLIITSSKTYQKSLQTKYPFLKEKIKNNYFGYTEKINLDMNEIEDKNKLRIAYAGNMGGLQSPEILYKAFKLGNLGNIELYFIGNINTNIFLSKIKDDRVKFIEFLPHDKFLKFMSQKIDIGFVSLTSDYLGACVPSKIYEYINLGLPMIGALPDGDGRDIINNNDYGIACKYDDINGLIEALKIYENKKYLQHIKNNIIKDRDSWSMKNKIKEVDCWLKELLSDN